MKAVLPENEADRLATLFAYGVLDTPAEPGFDRMTRLAARAFDAPVSLISLVDSHRQFHKSHLGTDRVEAPRDHSLCSHAILTSELTVVCDASLDHRFADSPFVTEEPQIRFYVAAPLETADGFRLGTLCVIDTETRPYPNADQLALLKDLAAGVVELLEFHRAKRDLMSLQQSLQEQTRILAASREESSRAAQRALIALEAGRMGYWERDAVTDKISFSPLLEDLLGIDHWEYDGSVEGWLAHVHPDDHQLIAERIEEARQKQQNYTFKYRPLTEDGTERWVTTTGTYFKDEQGHFAGAHGVSWDSTETEVATRNLRLSEELFRVLNEGAPIGIFRSGLNGNVLNANARLAAIYGMDDQEVLGRGWFRHVHPDDRDAILSQVLSPASREGFCEYQHRLLLPDGTVRWVSVRTSVLHDQDGRVVGKVGTLDDITKQKQMLEDLHLAKETAELANRAKDRFLANVSHELRTPLNGVMGMSELLLETTGLDAGQREMAEVISDSARGLLAVVNDMLDLSRIEAGHLAVDRQPFNLNATVQQTTSMFKAEALKKGVSLEISYDAGLADWYVGDAGRVRQILTNYISNALKFTSDGTVHIEAKANGTQGEIELSVRDNGPGISEQDQQRLFRPFSQLDSSSTRKHGGAGLGLAINKRLAELMHGTVGVTSAEGQGATFWVRLPLVEQQDHVESILLRNSQPPQSPYQSPYQASGRVLVVEDNPVNQKVAVGVLKKLGCEVDVADNGIVALELFKTHNYSLVFMDCQMPEMDGYTATRHIRQWEAAHSKKAVPIVALTAHAMMGDRERCLQAGMNDHLPKPLSVEALRSTLNAWVIPPPARSA